MGALVKSHGDIDQAMAVLKKRAIPDAMALLEACRKGGRYDVVGYPTMPDVLVTQGPKDPDQIWEARPKWKYEGPVAPFLPVAALDVNGAYLSALKTHLPLGALVHSTGNSHDPRRAGVHLVTPPPWEISILPNPIGDRDEAGPLWITEPTLRLLLRLASPKYDLCEAPVIHESWTSGASESLLESFRKTLATARDTAVQEDDELTLEYVKAMYSKFVSTLGESNFNRDLYRQDWMHIIRAQAFANLYWKAVKASQAGLRVIRMTGTDELHVAGDWTKVFTEGRKLTEMKIKDTYTT